MPDEKFAAIFGAELAGQIDQLAHNQHLSAKAAQDAKERAQADRTAKHLRMADVVMLAMRQGREELRDQIGRLLAGRAPREAETAQLEMCVSAIRDDEMRKRRERRARREGSK